MAKKSDVPRSTLLEKKKKKEKKIKLFYIEKEKKKIAGVNLKIATWLQELIPHPAPVVLELNITDIMEWWRH